MPNKIVKNQIAPCGMNCGVCKAYLREKNPCHGCNFAGQNKPKTRLNCPLRICKKRKSKFCYDCGEFPCERLKHLDKRYREKYGISEIENLINIRDQGINKFLEKENQKWCSEKGILCVHDKKFYKTFKNSSLIE